MLSSARFKGFIRRLVTGELLRGNLDLRYADLCGHAIAAAGSDGAGVVIVGANDGKFNDPLYEVLAHNAARTRVLAIEPQASLIPILNENFAWHPHFVAYRGAIGDGSEMTLYTVAPEFWDDLDVPYAASWPRHRAPSGIASGDRARVAAWIDRYLSDPVKRTAALLEDRLTAETLPAVIEHTGFGNPVDICQVDVEGFDDIVLLNCDLPRLRPSVLRFEHKLLSDERRTAVVNLLDDIGYVRVQSDQDCVAYLPERLGR